MSPPSLVIRVAPSALHSVLVSDIKQVSTCPLHNGSMSSLPDHEGSEVVVCAKPINR